ncbi:MAG: P-II family nitrogen regulator [Polymorphobacter sp.]|uniref:P-II family nitrogen regulator n=1 Tax=Polymorphobacter sp. TaxID=1909290 RepID=UPI003A840770
MKLVIAMIKPFRLDAVRAALTALDVRGMTVSEVLGSGDGGPGSAGKMVPRLKIEVVVEDRQLGTVIEAVQGAAATGEVGDGKIFVAEVGKAVRIRTGETDEAAI